ncbi:DUF6559 family protein [Aeromonas schubertii]|uniref:Uncharacterized protein n=1 Tax=Aeromonas schubertii TaxID=652 RepID=A0ABS7V5Z6_9GAMM|nr:DUF6559 family protein [Aeromonas schubertii]MBZ6064790.1 hypothetical protein [Aeromonas schubertii]
MSLIARLRLRRALKRVLPLALRLQRDYGPADAYTRAQLENLANREKLGTLARQALHALFRQPGSEEQGLLALRTKLASRLFDPGHIFTAHDLLTLCKSGGWRGGTDRTVQTQGARFHQY